MHLYTLAANPINLAACLWADGISTRGVFSIFSLYACDT